MDIYSELKIKQQELKYNLDIEIFIIAQFSEILKSLIVVSLPSLDIDGFAHL